MQIQDGAMSYTSIKGSRFTSNELAEFRTKYPKAKYISANVGEAPLGADAPTYMAGYIVEMAKAAEIVTVKRNGSSTEYRFTSNGIDPEAVPDEYMGFSESPVSGYVLVDSAGRITTAYAATSDLTTWVRVSYSYKKVRITFPKPSETVKQEIFYSIVMGSVR